MLRTFSPQKYIHMKITRLALGVMDKKAVLGKQCALKSGHSEKKKNPTK